MVFAAARMLTVQGYVFSPRSEGFDVVEFLRADADREWGVASPDITASTLRIAMTTQVIAMTSPYTRRFFVRNRDLFERKRRFVAGDHTN